MKESFILKLKEIVGEGDLFYEEADLHTYSYDSAVLEPVVPEVVVRPRTQEALGKVIKFLAEEGYSITVRGAGTNLSGGTIPAREKGAVILTNGLNKILEINPEDMFARVEPGVITAKFANEVSKFGLFYPPDPGSQAVSTLGGNVAENAGGLRGLKYGVTKDYVMGIKFFDAHGEIVTTGARTVKCVTGYNLTSLMVGSEGTLGVFSEITLKLIPPPKSSKAMMAIFDSMEGASNTVSDIIGNHIIPVTLEFLDNFTIRAVEDFRSAGLPKDAMALLLIEVDGHPMQVEEEFREIEKIVKKNKVKDLVVARSEKQKQSVWQARRDALPALARLSPTTVLEDATVPRSKIPQMVNEIITLQKKYNLKIGTFGHAGDGNLHPTFLTDIRDKEEFSRVEKAIDELFDVAISLGGTLSGEHGIGLAKSKFMSKEVTYGTILYSKRLKQALDPNNVLNPQKIIGDQ